MLETMDVAPINSIEYVTLAALMLERAGYHATLKRFSGNTLQPEGLKERALRIASLAEDTSAAGTLGALQLNPVTMRELAAIQPSIRDARPPGWFRSHSDQRPAELDRNHPTLAAFRALQFEVSMHRNNTTNTGDPRGFVVEFNPVAEIPMPAQPAEEQRTAMEALYAREIELATEALAERQRRELAAASATTTGAQYVEWQRYSSLGAADDGDVF